MKLVWIALLFLLPIPVFANEGFMPVYSPPNPPSGSGPITNYCISGQFFDSYNSTTKLFTCAIPSGSGENNTASNIGGGIELYKQKIGVDLQFRTLVNDTNISIQQLTNTVSISLNVISKSMISSVGQFGWSEVSKIGSSLHDLADVASSCAVGKTLIFNSTNFWDCYTITSSSLKVNNQAAQNGRFITGINNSTGAITTQTFQVNTQTAQNDYQITGINNVTGIITTNQFSVNTKDCGSNFVKSIDNATGDVQCASSTGSGITSLGANVTGTLPGTDYLVWTIPLTANSGNTVSGVITATTTVTGTAVRAGANVTNLNTRGYCHWTDMATTTSTAEDYIVMNTVLTGRVTNTGETLWVPAANVAAPIEFWCSVKTGSTAGNMKIYITPETTGATIEAKAGSYYIKTP